MDLLYTFVMFIFGKLPVNDGDSGDCTSVASRLLPMTRFLQILCLPSSPAFVFSVTRFYSDWLREPSTTSLFTQLLGSIVTGYDSPVPLPCSHSSWVSDWLREAGFFLIATQYHLPVHTAPGLVTGYERPVPPPWSNSSSVL